MNVSRVKYAYGFSGGCVIVVLDAGDDVEDTDDSRW